MSTTKEILDHGPEFVEGDEVPFIPWSVLARARRARQKMEGQPSYRWYVMVVVLGGFFSAGITVTILSVAIKDIAAEFGSSEATVSWIVTGPFLGFAVLQPTLGKLGDLFGHKRLYVVSFAAEAVAALLIAAAWNVPSLIFFRILGGIVGAAAGPASMALLFQVFPPQERVRAMGWWSFVGAGSPVLGVVLGGPIIDHFSWRWIFVAQAPLCVAAFVLGAWLLPSLTAHAIRPRFDLKGSMLLTLSVAAVLLAVNRSSILGWRSPFVVACLMLAPLGAIGFVLAERRASSPLLPLWLLRRRNFVAPLLTQFFGNFAYMGSFLITPLYLSDVLGFSASAVGRTVIARPLTFSVAAPLFGLVAVKLGERFNAVAGMAAIVCSMALFSSLGTQPSQRLVILALALSGVGLGMASPSLSATVANAVPEENLGTASAAVGMMQSIGGVLGMELLRSFRDFRVSAGISVPQAYGQAYRFGALMSVGALIAAFFVSRLKVEGEPTTPVRRRRGAAVRPRR